MSYQDLEDAVGDLVGDYTRVIMAMMDYKMKSDEATNIMAKATVNLAAQIEARIDEKLAEAWRNAQHIGDV